MANDFTASMSLFPAQEKKSENSPDHSGTIEFLASDISAVVEYLQTSERSKNWKDEEVVKIRVAAWNSVAKGSGKAYLSGRVSPPLPPKEDIGF